MNTEIEDTFDAMVNTIEGISKALVEIVESIENLDKRISALEQRDIPNIQMDSAIEGGARGGKL